MLTAAAPIAMHAAFIYSSLLTIKTSPWSMARAVVVLPRDIVRLHWGRLPGLAMAIDWLVVLWHH